ncbi:MAG: Methylamine utilization protein mauG [Myxococcaceae bacterium]|nr:Methylamine utilization protein mauG [Myxococcaceae bacterium]
MKWSSRSRPLAVLVTCVLASFATSLGCKGADDPQDSAAQQGGNDLTRASNPEAELPINVLQSMKGVRPVEPRALGTIVRDRKAAIALGKALFWDVNAGSDGQACASCHAHAGADNRTTNQLSPGLNNVAGGTKSQAFDGVASRGTGGPNYTLTAKDFPFHQLSDKNDPNSSVVFDSDDVVSSQGTIHRVFVSTKTEDGREMCTDAPDIFAVGKKNIRRVPPRNTPTNINAVFFDRLFWDGRANNTFNGVSPFGPRDKAATILERQADGKAHEVQLRLENAALASQAVGPILSAMEMSCEGRTFSDVGRKLLPMKPLALQDVASDDSVLGVLTGNKKSGKSKGLTTTYEDLVKQAFDPKYWSVTGKKSDGHSEGYSQIERNFSLFWGLSIMLYEATLTSDDAPIDRYLDGDKTALTPQQIYGKSLFEGQAGCINCHHGPAISGAAFSFAKEANETNPIERMAMNDGRIALYDNGFYNIGVRPTVEDRGVGGLDPWGNPLSLAREAKRAAAGIPAPESLRFDNARFLLNRGSPPGPGEREATDGCFKTPTLRNVELTGPYFHNGGQATLEQVVDFYNRGGDRRGGTLITFDGEQIVTGADSTSFGDNQSNMGADLQRLFLTAAGKAAIVAFLKSFTDERVRWEKAPFDHPSIDLPNGVTVESSDDSEKSSDSGKSKSDK